MMVVISDKAIDNLKKNIYKYIILIIYSQRTILSSLFSDECNFPSADKSYSFLKRRQIWLRINITELRQS